MSTPVRKDNLIWIDCEMTGLSPFFPAPELSPAQRSVWKPDQILEIAVIVTDAHLVPLDRGIELIIQTPLDVIERMNDWCIAQHGKTGLTQSCLTSTVSMHDADLAVVDYVAKHFPQGFEMALLAGNSVHVDKAFLSKDFPLLHSKLHYRILDVSSFKELASRMYPDLPRPKKSDSAHRAMSDIEDSIAELKYYQAQIFKSPSEYSSR